VNAAAPAIRPSVHIRASDVPVSRGMLSLLGQCGFPLAAEADAVPGTVVMVIAATVEEATEMYLRPRPPDGCPPLLVAERFSSAGVLRALQTGASTMLRSGGATRAQVTAAVQAAYCGDSRVPQEMLIRVLGSKTTLNRPPPPAAGPPPLLTARQRVVLALMADGLGNAEIAQALCCSEHTVKNVSYELMARLQVRNRAHAVAHAVRRGLV
jgi:DNA-binding NarL/FixJ family response regulator